MSSSDSMRRYDGQSHRLDSALTGRVPLVVVPPGWTGNTVQVEMKGQEAEERRMERGDGDRSGPRDGQDPQRRTRWDQGLKRLSGLTDGRVRTGHVARLG